VGRESDHVFTLKQVASYQRFAFEPDLARRRGTQRRRIVPDPSPAGSPSSYSARQETGGQIRWLRVPV